MYYHNYMYSLTSLAACVPRHAIPEQSFSRVDNGID